MADSEDSVEATPCESCAIKDKTIVALAEALSRAMTKPQPQPVVFPLNPPTSPEPYKWPSPNNTIRWDASQCPCQPANGGSGICGCILGGPQITC